MTTRCVSLVGLQACLLLLVGCGPGDFADLSEPEYDAPGWQVRCVVHGED